MKNIDKIKKNSKFYNLLTTYLRNPFIQLLLALLSISYFQQSITQFLKTIAANNRAPLNDENQIHFFKIGDQKVVIKENFIYEPYIDADLAAKNMAAKHTLYDFEDLQLIAQKMALSPRPRLNLISNIEPTLKSLLSNMVFGNKQFQGTFLQRVVGGYVTGLNNLVRKEQSIITQDIIHNIALYHSTTDTKEQIDLNTKKDEYKDGVLLKWFFKKMHADILSLHFLLQKKIELKLIAAKESALSDIQENNRYGHTLSELLENDCHKSLKENAVYCDLSQIEYHRTFCFNIKRGIANQGDCMKEKASILDNKNSFSKYPECQDFVDSKDFSYDTLIQMLPVKKEKSKSVWNGFF